MQSRISEMALINKLGSVEHIFSSTTHPPINKLVIAKPTKKASCSLLLSDISASRLLPTKSDKGRIRIFR